MEMINYEYVQLFSFIYHGQGQGFTTKNIDSSKVTVMQVYFRVFQSVLETFGITKAHVHYQKILTVIQTGQYFNMSLLLCTVNTEKSFPLIFTLCIINIYHCTCCNTINEEKTLTCIFSVYPTLNANISAVVRWIYLLQNAADSLECSLEDCGDLGTRHRFVALRMRSQ